nr:MAG TPA: hypothetical protein [Caudoviricetes sp.]
MTGKRNGLLSISDGRLFFVYINESSLIDVKQKS